MFPAMPSFNSDGVEIAFDDEGEGEAILLIHGFGSNARVNWRDTGWFNTLNEAGRRVIAIDNRGHGRSGAPHEPSHYSVPIMAEDARRLLDHLGIVQASVMGYSMGASIATWHTITHPARVDHLILGGLASNIIRGVGGHEELAAALEAPSLSPDASPKAKDYRQFAEQTKSDRLALAACMRGIRHPIAEGELASIACPVLIVCGELDEVAGSVDKLVSLIPGAKGVVLPRRNHMNTVGDRGYKKAVLEFLG
jgi:pimeloyl-ACP methyl ester carboxylesterase